MRLAIENDSLLSQVKALCCTSMEQKHNIDAHRDVAKKYPVLNRVRNQRLGPLDGL